MGLINNGYKFYQKLHLSFDYVSIILNMFRIVFTKVICQYFMCSQLSGMISSWEGAYANNTILNLLSQQVGMFSIKRIYRS